MFCYDTKSSCNRACMKGVVLYGSFLCLRSKPSLAWRPICWLRLVSRWYETQSADGRSKESRRRRRTTDRPETTSRQQATKKDTARQSLHDTTYASFRQTEKIISKEENSFAKHSQTKLNSGVFLPNGAELRLSVCQTDLNLVLNSK